jgi:small nuclear ribonucleoprotein D3
MASKNIGIPIKVLHDAEGHTVTVELRNGEVYRGKLDEAEDNMNVHLSNCTKTMKDGRVQMLSKCAACLSLRPCV